MLSPGMSAAVTNTTFVQSKPSSRSNPSRRAWASLERIVAPELRSPNPEKRHAGLENLETLAALSQELSNLLFWRALRGIVPRS